MLTSSLLFITNVMAQDDPANKPTAANEAADTNSAMIVLNAPNLKGSTLKRDKSHKQVVLKQKSKKANSITDDEEWFANNQLKVSGIIYETTPNYPYNHKAPTPDLMTFNNIPLRNVYEYGNTQIYAYGDIYYNVKTLLIVKDGKITHKMNFENFAKPHGHYIGWVMLEDDILYIQHTGEGYADGFNGQNAYISAISLKDNQILWTTKPLTSNSRNFIISGNSIITGYGFTDEPDFLYVIDKFSGTRVQTLKLKTGPDYIIEKDGLIYVRTYNTDYTFSIK